MYRLRRRVLRQAVINSCRSEVAVERLRKRNPSCELTRLDIAGLREPCQPVKPDGLVVFSVSGRCGAGLVHRQTLPDTVKQVVLQQECEHQGCPSGTAGTEDIQIDWITIDNPA
jgi:hypothetical protein